MDEQPRYRVDTLEHGGHEPDEAQGVDDVTNDGVLRESDNPACSRFDH